MITVGIRVSYIKYNEAPIILNVLSVHVLIVVFTIIIHTLKTYRVLEIP